jgi:hypothetical protein
VGLDELDAHERRLIWFEELASFLEPEVIESGNGQGAAGRRPG